MLIGQTIKRGDKIPLVAFNGSAYECGRQYAVSTLHNYPGYKVYLRQVVNEWSTPDEKVVKLFKAHAPYILDIYRGMLEVLQENSFDAECENEQAVPEECTSFAVSPELCTDNAPISGQTKDTGIDSLKYYTVLRMRLTDGPTILIVAYPGELLGYGMWSNGNTLFRNDLKSSSGGEKGLSMVQFGLLALASADISEMVEIAKEYGIKGAGNLLLSDHKGDSVSIEFNVGGVDFIYPENGILVHANHPVGANTANFENYVDKIEKENSRYRHEKLRKLIYNNSKDFNEIKAFECLADHSAYPRGICRHIIGDREDKCTTTAIVAEPARGRLNVTKGPACLNDYEIYSV